MRTRIRLVGTLLALVVAAPCFGAATALAAQRENTPTSEEKTIAVFGQEIRYWDIGSGPVLVLLHGLGASKELDWNRVALPLSRKYRVIAPDQIGFGHSAKPLLDYRIQTYVDFLGEFLRDLKIEKASLAGESLGGWIAAMYTMESSGNTQMVPVEKLILSDAAGLRQDHPIPNLNPSTLEDMKKVMQAVFYDTSWLNDQTLRKIFADQIAKGDGFTIHSLLSNPALPSELLDGKLGGIHAPTLVVWGKQDALLPLASGERYASEIAGAHLVTFEKCGHVPPEEKSAEFIAAVAAFLDGGAAQTH